MPYFVILLCLMPDDFIRQRKSVSTLLVINFFGFTILFIKRNCVGQLSIWISPVYYFTIFTPKTQGECLMVYFSFQSCRTNEERKFWIFQVLWITIWPCLYGLISFNYPLMRDSILIEPRIIFCSDGYKLTPEK